MKHGEDIHMSLRSVWRRPVESLLLILGISLGIGATAAGVAMAVRAVEQAKALLSSTKYREIVVTVREDAEEMDVPASPQQTDNTVILTSAELRARDDAEDVQYAYVADPMGMRLGAFTQGQAANRQDRGSAPPQPAQGSDRSTGGTETQDAESGSLASGTYKGRESEHPGEEQPQQQWFRSAGEEIPVPEGPEPELDELRGFAVSPEFFKAWDLVAAEGSLFTLRDMEKAEPILILGSTIAQTLFADGESLGRQVLSRGWMGRRLYKIIGVLEPTGTELDTRVFVPAMMPNLQMPHLQTGGRIEMRFMNWNTSLHFTVADSNRLEEAKAQLESWFDQNYGPGSVVITIPREEAEAARDRNTRLVTVILFLALSALLIAAVNVTNILYSRAMRKRRSVGILKALGATVRNVFSLFFLEAALVGAGGAAIGAGVSVLMSKLMEATMGFGGVHVVVLILGILASWAVVSALTVLPAIQASRIAAADAIRYE